jgi:hypothetical protein
VGAALYDLSIVDDQNLIRVPLSRSSISHPAGAGNNLPRAMILALLHGNTLHSRVLQRIDPVIDHRRRLVNIASLDPEHELELDGHQ